MTVPDAEVRHVQQFEPVEVAARLLPTFLQRGCFLPQSIRLTPEKIVILDAYPLPEKYKQL